ncbi:MAG: TraM recognition domain-containing protein [Mycobacterium sp.]|nr:TraM recognition domain-containing protein [Mycobacterium sp.]
MSAARQVRRRSRASLSEDTAKLLAGLTICAIGAGVWAALTVGSLWAGLVVNMNPFGALLEVVSGQRRWPWQSSVVVITFLAVAAGGLTMFVSRREPRAEIDIAARTMQRPSGLTIARERDNAAAAKRLLADAPRDIRDIPGPPLGQTVTGNVWLYLPAELGAFIAAGTRTGKTMAWAVPAVLAAWGPVIATSNRPDLYRHTRFSRERTGRIWLMDQQGVTGHPEVGFWVDLLAQVETLAAARKLASFWVAASRDPDARVDSYFDGGAQTLLALYMFAAARAGGDLLHVGEWLSRDQDPTPALILRRFGHDRAAQRITDAQALYARQRDGLFDMARRFLDVLTDDDYARMVTPPQRRTFEAFDSGDTVTVRWRLETPTHQLPQFVPEDFIHSRDSLYALSMAGPDGATPLTTALVGQLLEAALRAARRRPDGRLEVPLLGVLDEAANCCRIAELPDYYTYAGGHGVLLMTFIQVLEQGEKLWGEGGLATIRAQSIEIYGGGIGDPDYLQAWVTMADEHEVAERSRSTGSTGASETTTWRSESNLTVADLNAMPKSRALVRLPTHKPILVRKVPWWEGPAASDIQRSLALFAPAEPPPAYTDDSGPAESTETEQAQEL